MSGRQSPPLRVVIDDGLRRRARPHRLTEWDHAVADLVAAQRFGAELPTDLDRLTVRLDTEALWLDLTSSDADPWRVARVPLQPLRRLMADYLLMIDQIEQLEEGFGSPRFDALDMAKRVYHDEAAEIVQRALAGTLDPDHQTARHLFTLLLVMLHDTSVTAGRR